MKISGFTFIHDGIIGGYPFAEAITAVRPWVDEIVAVDIESTDRTPEVLQKLGCKVLPGHFHGNDTCPENFKLHTACEGELIIFFEADEVWHDDLLSAAMWAIERGERDRAVYRIQVTQNFQRIKQYPIPIHRIFPKGGGSYVAHPTNVPDGIFIIPQDAGYLWDCSNCFRDSWLDRKRNQIKFFGCDRPLYVPEHFTNLHEFLSEADCQQFLNEPFWEWTATPLAIPAILKPLVGKTYYEAGI